GEDDGTVFGVNLTGSIFTNLYSFSGNDGYQPAWELTVSGNTLYGTTDNGGVNGVSSSYYGAVFQINTHSTGFSTVCSFNSLNGWGPQCGLVLSGGNFYGTTAGGGLLATGGYADGTV